VIGTVCSIVPDLDVIGFRFGIRYGDFWGHRGFAHSLFFAALLALVIVVLGFRHGVTGMHALTLWLYLFLATCGPQLIVYVVSGKNSRIPSAFSEPKSKHVNKCVIASPLECGGRGGIQVAHEPELPLRSSVLDRDREDSLAHG
jgi:hypothetical protein